MDNKKRGAWMITRTAAPTEKDGAGQEKKPDEADGKEG